LADEIAQLYRSSDIRFTLPSQAWRRGTLDTYSFIKKVDSRNFENK